MRSSKSFVTVKDKNDKYRKNLTDCNIVIGEIFCVSIFYLKDNLI